MIVLGTKTIETRTHRGLAACADHRIAVHASAAKTGIERRWASISIAKEYADAKADAPESSLDMFGAPDFRPLFGAVLGTVFVVEHRILTVKDERAARCRITDNVFGLVLRDPILFTRPIPARGSFGVWEWKGEPPP
jgi:hypothetical protein